MRRIAYALVVAAVPTIAVAREWSFTYGSGELQRIDLNERIEAASCSGGGQVVVPPGCWVSDPIVLKSNVELHLQSGSELVFTDELEKYLPAVRTSHEGVECYNYRPLIYAYGATNISLTGCGTLRPMMGRWETWRWNVASSKEAKRILNEEWGARDVPIEQRDLTKLPGAKTRPQFIGLNACSGVRLEGFSLRDSPFWCIHLLHCENVKVRGLSVRAFLNNSDGIDVECSRDVSIEDCSFDQGDDVIVLKSGKDRDGRRRATPTENVTIRRCRAGSGHGFLVVGSECSGGVRNVTMEDCRVDGSLDTLFKVKTTPKRGGFIKDITMRRVKARTIISSVIDVNAAYAINGSPDDAEDALTEIDGLVVEDVDVVDAGRRLSVVGDARRPIRNLFVRNVVLGTSARQDIVENAELSDRVPVGLGWRTLLPRPIFDERPELVDFYYKAWELAHARIDNVSGLPASRYMDEAHRSDRIWIWDTCFMVHFCKYCPQEFPGIESLENFYGVMLADEERPLPKVKGNRWCGADEGKMLDFRIHHPDNPPLFAWTEYVYALQTGDRARLEKVYSENRWLQRWYELFENFDPAAPQPFGSVQKVMAKRTADGFRWGGCPSGMDNTPRGRAGAKDAGHPGKCPDNPDLLWVDALAQQGLSALYLSHIAALLGRADEAMSWTAKYESVKAKVNEIYWDEADGFYYDILASDRSKCKVMTPASFWPVLAEMTSPDRVRRMACRLTDEKSLGGLVPTVSLARNDADFIDNGGYWRGAVWLPTSYMTVKALDISGETSLARTVARQIVEHMYKTYVAYEPHTIWECYSPSEAKPAVTAKTGKIVRSDFCGWSALGPISLFIEDIIGVKEANAFTDTLVCDFEKKPRGRVGVENYRFGDVVCSLMADANSIVVDSNRPFKLVADGKSYPVVKGKNVYER